MKTALMVMLFSVLLITACSSSNITKTQYYVLNSPTKLMPKIVNNKVSKAQNKPAISVTLLELPDYLTQPNLVLQLSHHQLHYSNFHMWAEPLNIGLSQALTKDLNITNQNFNFLVSPELKATTTSDIVIEITAFQATHQSQVILVGSYTLRSARLTLEDTEKSSINTFRFALDLNDNGYPHAVEKMRKITLLLAQEISADIAG
jgi:uncharacterized lipoprotein YmbA